MQAELLLDSRLELGEGPTWDAEAGVLYFVDIHAGDVHVFNPDDETHRSLNLGEPVGCVALRQAEQQIQGDGCNLILALRSGFASVHIPSSCLDGMTGPSLRNNEGVKYLINPEPDLPGNRFNDGKCDPAGRFLAGTMDNAEKKASGSLYSYFPDGRLKILLTGLSISNGLTWSPDSKTFYFIDTPTRLVMAYDYDIDSGNIARPRPVIHIPEEIGWPDGMTSDMQGMLWIALWGGGKVTRWDPATGQNLAIHHVPALNVTSCIFGGPDRGDLYITTARKGMSGGQLAEYPFSGGLFHLRPGVQGIPTYQYWG